MKFQIAIAVGVFFGSAGGGSIATAQPAPRGECESCDASPCGCAGHGSGCCCSGICSQAPPNPLAPGRPSPPPCCADGICYPNYEYWGHYTTRWRPWPGELAATTPGGATAPPAARPGVPTYEVLPPEEEDRRAPPPSAPRGKPVELAPQKEAAPERTRETAPTTSSPAAPIPPQDGPGTELTPESILGLPPEEIGPGGTSPPATPSPGAPFDESPGTTPLVPPAGGASSPATAPLGRPMGDDDLPPSPPFAAPKLSAEPAGRPLAQPPQPVPKNKASFTPQDDPPPALPGAMASVSR